MGLWKSYQYYLKTRPVVTKCLTTGTLLFLGDMNQQLLCYRFSKDSLKAKPDETFLRDHWNSKYSLAMGTYGLTFSGPTIHFWVTRIIHRLIPYGNAPGCFAKAIFDWAFGAGFMLPVFFVSINMMEGNGYGAGVKKLKDEWWNTITTSIKIMPFLQTANFLLTPVMYQQLVMNAIVFFWFGYLSWVQHVDKEHRIPQENLREWDEIKHSLADPVLSHLHLTEPSDTPTPTVLQTATITPIVTQPMSGSETKSV